MPFTCGSQQYETEYFSVHCQSFSIMASTKKLQAEETKIFLESDSDAYSEEKKRKNKIKRVIPILR
jgi:hypothetical protein